ncbi:MAG TPA: DUF1622 domain-containing protein [Candidatus Bathyarchaeia archaeon]
METSRVSVVGFAIIGSMIAAAVLVAIYGSLQSDFLLSLENVVIIVLTTAINFLYVIGAGLIVLGSILVTTRYVKSKLKAPFQPFSGLPRARYLTVSLEIFIGAEIIKTVIARSFEEFYLLSFTIGIRGLVAGILYLERRWHGEHPDHIEPLESKPT